MSHPAPFGFEQLTTELIRGVIETVAERPGESGARRLARQQTTVFSVMAFLPRDAVETMLAGQCVIFDHLFRDGAGDLLRGQTEQIKLRARPQLVSTGNAFLKHLNQAITLQARPAEQIAVVPRAAKAPSAEAAEAPPAQAEPIAGTDPREARLAEMLPDFAPVRRPGPSVSGIALAAAARKPEDNVPFPLASRAAIPGGSPPARAVAGAGPG